MLTTRISRILALVLLIATPMGGAADIVERIDSLLTLYDGSQGAERQRVGQKLLDIYAKADVFFAEPPTLSDKSAKRGMPKDSVDLTVWFSTERYFTTKSFYDKALVYNDRAMRLVTKRQADVHCTLLCDRAYCLFKQSEYTEATNVGQEAVTLSQQTDNLLQLSRAYLYLSLVNHSMRDYEQAKKLVLKSIETNDKLGVNVQTHNVLGVACEIFCSAREVDQGIEYGLKAVEAAQAIDYQPGVANHLTQLSYAYDRKGDYQRGLEAAEQAIAIVESIEPLDRNQLALSLEFKSWNLLDLGRNQEAVDVMRQAIAYEEAVGNKSAVRYDYRTLCEALEPLDAKAALQAMKIYSSMSDSIHTAQLNEAVGKANAELRNDELQEENAQSRRMNRIIFYTFIGLSLLLFIAITALWYANRLKNRTNQTLQRLTEVRESFFTNVTHEFRTPLTVILGMSQELQSRPSTDPEQLKRTGQLIERQGTQLLTLVNQLLDISKVRSAIGEQPESMGNVVTYVSMVVDSFHEQALQKGITLDFSPATSVIETSYVPDYMQKIVSNLLSNAIKFTPDGGTIRVRLQQKDDRMLLSVSDTGRGISAKHLPHIFDPFYQVDSSGEIGTGVGLTLVKQIVCALNGEITAESRPGKGTTFNVQLPIKKVEDQLEAEDNAEAHEGNSTRLLVVEDNPDVAYYIGHLLAGRYDVHYATDGQQGIEMARTLIPDLIITDLMMPHTDGLALCRAIRGDSITSHIPLVVVTAKATDADRLKGLEAGADAYLYKPFNADELNVRVAKLLEQRQMLRDKYVQQEIVSPVRLRSATEQESATDAPTPQAATRQQDNFASASTEFLDRLHTLVLELMPRGEADVEHVATALSMSPSQLRRKVSAITGTTPKQYIVSLQLTTARNMLTEHPDRTITDVAERCGFYDQAHFTRAFHNAYGTTPGQLLQQAETRGGGKRLKG